MHLYFTKTMQNNGLVEVITLISNFHTNISLSFSLSSSCFSLITVITINKSHLFLFLRWFCQDSQQWRLRNSIDTCTILIIMDDVLLYCDNPKTLLRMDRTPTGEIVLLQRPGRRRNNKRRRGTFPQTRSRHARRISLILGSKNASACMHVPYYPPILLLTLSMN